MSKQIVLKVTEPQAAFHSMTCKYPAFVGGFGSGKSETMCNQAIIDASTSSEALISLYAPTYDLVRLILAPRLLSKLTEFGIEYDFNKTENYIQTKSSQFGNFILRSLDTPERIVGYESYRAHIDEIDILPEKQANEAWNKILGRNRQHLVGISGQLNRVSAYSTPEGFNFVYNRWVKNKADGYEMVKASSRTNPFLPDDYISSLETSYSPELVAAYIEGEFVNLNSGTVYNAYSRTQHDSQEEIKDKEELYIGIDFNVTKMAATIFVKRNKAFHAVDELKNVYDTPEMIEIIKRRYIDHRIICYPDASGSSRKSVDASTSDIALLSQAGFEIRAPRKNPLVKDRILAVNQAFRSNLLFVNQRACPTVSECLEQQSYGENGEPDKKTGRDHQNDSVGYCIVYEMPVKKPVINIPVEYIRGN